MKGYVLADIADEELAGIATAEPQTASGKGAASELLARHQRRVYLWCYRYVRDHERALELAQDVLLKAYRSLAAFRRGSKFTSWLFVIARNHCLSALRSPAILVDEESELSQLSDPAKGPEDLLVEKLEEAELLELMRLTLDEREQEALWLRCYEKMPIDEITRVLGITSTTGARGLLQTARRKLRAALARRAQEGS
jgi:RNA polymerase sigma-70 factor (ECF subfamily)